MSPDGTEAEINIVGHPHCPTESIVGTTPTKRQFDSDDSELDNWGGVDIDVHMVRAQYITVECVEAAKYWAQRLLELAHELPRHETWWPDCWVILVLYIA